MLYTFYSILRCDAVCTLHLLVQCIRQWIEDHFGLSLIQIDPLFTKIFTKNYFYIFQWPWPLMTKLLSKSSPSYSCPGSLLREIWSFYGFSVSNNCRHRWTDGWSAMFHLAYWGRRATRKQRTQNTETELTWLSHFLRYSTIIWGGLCFYLSA